MFDQTKESSRTFTLKYFLSFYEGLALPPSLADCAVLFFAGLLSPPSCPYCRQRVTMILPYFSQEERDAADLTVVEGRGNVLNQIREFNRRFSGTFICFFLSLCNTNLVRRSFWASPNRSWPKTDSDRSNGPIRNILSPLVRSFHKVWLTLSVLQV